MERFTSDREQAIDVILNDDGLRKEVIASLANTYTLKSMAPDNVRPLLAEFKVGDDKVMIVNQWDLEDGILRYYGYGDRQLEEVN